MDLMTWDATTFADLISCLSLIMSGSKSDSDYMSCEACLKATAAPSKEYFVIDGASHIQTYYVPVYVDAASGKLTEFFGRNL